MTKNRIFSKKRVIFYFLSNKKHIFVIVLSQELSIDTIIGNKIFILNFGQRGDPYLKKWKKNILIYIV